MELEAQLIAAGYKPEDAKKLAEGFVQGLKELGITDAPPDDDIAQAAPAIQKVVESKYDIDKILVKMGCKAVLAESYGPFIEQAMVEFDIHTPKTSAMFIAQILHESARLTAVAEDLFYTEQGLLKTFDRYFDRNNARAYARKPEKIANRVYANRNGNGPESSGDGWRYRGRGLIQITGKANYRDCGEQLKEDLLKHPEILETPNGAARSAAWYWWSRKLNRSAEAGDIKTNTRAINGGLNGYDDRVMLYNKATKLF